ncbi:MAG: hypothetical protein Q7S01_04470 [bacterium]|nr:hypothetical protein [bacterium]
MGNSVKKKNVGKRAGSGSKDDLKVIKKELKAESERLKALEVRVGAIEQNLLGN